jgi:hypothetical protein
MSMPNFHEIERPEISQIAETMVFKTLWDRLPKKSFVSGLWLREFARTPLWKSCFHYVLPADKYRGFRHYYGNIILLTPGESALLRQCTDESLINYALEIEERTGGKSTANWKAVKDLETDLLYLYREAFPMTFKGLIGYKYSLREQEEIVGRLNKEFWEDMSGRTGSENH